MPCWDAQRRVEAVLQRLVDESAIQSTLARYARAIDRMDFELLRTCYHPDAIDDHGVYTGGVEGFITYLEASLPRSESTTHFLGLPQIELAGDVAWVETQCLAILRFAAADGKPERDRLAKVRYCDRFERREGEWRIAHRLVAYDPGRIDPVVEGPGYGEAHTLGRRDRDDAAYRRLREQA
jgi:hypothetical protein